MPTINVKGGGAASPPGGGGGKVPDNVNAMVDFMGSNKRLAMGMMEAAQSEYRLRRMLVNEAKKMADAAQKAAETIAKAAAAQEKKSTQAAEKAERQVQADRAKRAKLEEQGAMRAYRMQEDVRRKEQRERENRARLEEQGSMRVFRMQEDDRRREERELRARTQHRNKTRREALHAFGFGAIAGGAVGGFAAGDLGGILGAVGGGLGGGLGFMGGNAIGGPIGGLIGKAVGAAIGSLAGMAVNPFHSAYSAAKPFFDFQEDAYAVGRGRGQSGQGVQDALFRRGRIPQDFLAQAGLSPDAAAKALLQGPIAQGDIRETLTTFGNLTNRSGAFAGLGADAVQGVLGRGRGYGINAPTEAGTGRMQSLIDMLSEANARGFDKSKLLDSVNTSLDTLVNNSGQADIKNITQMTKELMNTGLPGGMTGATSRGIVAGNAALGQNVLSNGLTTLMLSSLLPKYNNFKTAADVAKFAGVSADKIPSTAMADILDASKNGQFNTALRLVSSPAVMGAGQLQNRINEAYPSMGLPENMRSIVTSSAGGISLSEAQVDEQRRRMGDNGMSPLDKAIMRYNGNNPDYAAKVEAIYAKKFGGQATGQFDQKIGAAGYMKRLTDAGVPAGTAAMIVKEAQRDGINPLLLASIGLQESGLNPAQGFGGVNANGTRDFGMFQINSSNRGKYPKAFQAGNVGANVAAGADILAYTMRKNGVENFSNAPNSALYAKAEAGQGDLNAAHLSAAFLVPLADKFARAVDKFTDSIERFAGSGNPDKVGHAPPVAGKTFGERVYNRAFGQISP